MVMITWIGKFCFIFFVPDGCAMPYMIETSYQEYLGFGTSGESDHVSTEAVQADCNKTQLLRSAK